MKKVPRRESDKAKNMQDETETPEAVERPSKRRKIKTDEDAELKMYQGESGDSDEAQDTNQRMISDSEIHALVKSRPEPDIVRAAITSTLSSLTSDTRGCEAYIPSFALGQEFVTTLSLLRRLRPSMNFLIVTADNLTQIQLASGIKGSKQVRTCEYLRDALGRDTQNVVCANKQLLAIAKHRRAQVEGSADMDVLFIFFDATSIIVRDIRSRDC